MKAGLLAIAVCAGTLCAQDLPAGVESIFSEGVALQKAGDLAGAERAFSEVIRRGGKRAFVLNNLGLVVQQRGEHDRALGFFREAIAMDPAYVAPRVLAGVSLIALGKPGQAVSELEKALALDQDSAPARLALARAYVRARRPGRAIAQYRKLRDADPGNPEYRYQLARLYADLAASSFREMYDGDPGSARVRQLLAENYLAQGAYAEAAAAFEEALKADPKLPGLHLNLAQIRLRERDLEGARRQLLLELEVVPDSAMAAGLLKRVEEARAGR
jgi:Tfp pilus assembly protein PilF